MNIGIQTYSVNANLQQTFSGKKTLLKTTARKIELPRRASLQKTLALTALLGLSTLSMSALANNSANSSKRAQVENVQSKQISSKLDSIIAAQDSIIEVNNKKIAEMQLEIDKNNKIKRNEKTIANQKQQKENLYKWLMGLSLLSIPILAGTVLAIVSSKTSHSLYDAPDYYIYNSNSETDQWKKSLSKQDSDNDNIPTIGDLLMT